MDIREEEETFSFSKASRSTGAQPASCPVVTGGFYPGLKRPGREADNQLSTSTRDEMNVATNLLPLLRTVYRDSFNCVVTIA